MDFNKGSAIQEDVLKKYLDVDNYWKEKLIADTVKKLDRKKIDYYEKKKKINFISSKS